MASEEKQQIQFEVWDTKQIGNDTSNIRTYVIMQSHGHRIRVLAATLWPIGIGLKITGTKYVDICLEIGPIYWMFGIGRKV